MQDNKISIGKIVAVHGLKGMVKLKSFADPLDSIFDLILMLKNGQQIKISKAGLIKDGFLAAIEGCNDRNAAEKFVSAYLFADRQDFKASSEDEFYFADLINMVVYSADKKIGTVTAVFNFGAGDIIEIKFADSTTELYPFRDEIFPTIDLKNKQIQFVKPTEL